MEECNEGTADCDDSDGSGVTCVNTVGSFQCLCHQGFVPDDSRILPNMSANAYCTDIQECEEDVDVCIKDPHEDLTTYPHTVCNYTGDNPNMNDCILQEKVTRQNLLYTCQTIFKLCTGLMYEYARKLQLRVQLSIQCR